MNDNCIEYELRRFLIEKRTLSDAGQRPAGTPLPDGRDDNCLVCSPHFYRKLANVQDVSCSNVGNFFEQKDIALSADKAKLESQGNLDCAGVQTWYNDVDLLQLQFLFVPVVMDRHWSLAVVANFDNLFQYWQDSTRDASVRAPCIIICDSAGCHDAKGIAQNLRLFLLNEWCLRQSRASFPADFNAYVKTLLGGSPEKSTFEVENNTTRDGSQLPLLQASVPMQPTDNVQDCGLYCAQFVEEFLFRWPEVNRGQVEGGYIEGFDKNMFTHENIEGLRVAIRKHIENIKAKSE